MTAVGTLELSVGVTFFVTTILLAFKKYVLLIVTLAAVLFKKLPTVTFLVIALLEGESTITRRSSLDGAVRAVSSEIFFARSVISYYATVVKVALDENTFAAPVAAMRTR